MRQSFFCLALIAAIGTCIAQSKPERPALAIVEKKAGKVSFYTASGKRVSEVPTQKFPHELALSLDNRLLYVSNQGLLWRTDPGDGGNTLTVIDLATRKATATIQLGNERRPHGIAILPSTGELIVTTENPSGLLRIHPTSHKIVRKYDVQGKGPHMVMLGPGARTAWTSNSDSGDISVIDLATAAVLARFPTGRNPQGAVLSHDSRTVYLTTTGSNKIVIADSNTYKPTGEIATGDGPARIALTPDGKTLVYNLQTGEGVGFADAAEKRELARVRLPGRPLSLILSRDGKLAYLGIQDADKVVAVSVSERKIVQTIDLPPGAGPDTIMPLP